LRSPIFRQRHLLKKHPELEQKGLDSLDPTIRHYLWRKGFRSDDSILKLEQITGSLNLNCIMLVHLLPQRPTDIKLRMLRNLCENSETGQQKKNTIEINLKLSPNYTIKCKMIWPTVPLYHQAQVSKTKPAIKNPL
jgi:hypothetical protein